MGSELPPRGRTAGILAIALPGLFIAAGYRYGWKGWLLSFAVGVALVVAVARSGSRE